MYGRAAKKEAKRAAKNEKYREKEIRSTEKQLEKYQKKYDKRSDKYMKEYEKIRNSSKTDEEKDERLRKLDEKRDTKLYNYINMNTGQRRNLKSDISRGKKEIETLKNMTLDEIDEEKKALGAEKVKNFTGLYTVYGGNIGRDAAKSLYREGLYNKKNVDKDYQNYLERQGRSTKKQTNTKSSQSSYEEAFDKNLNKIRNDSKTKAAFRNYVKEQYQNRNLSEIDDDRLDAMMDNYAEFLTNRQLYK